MESVLDRVIKQNTENVNLLKTKDYNIFSVLQIQSKEVLICRMIADLLNPRGQHGAGAEYLKIFLRDCLGMEKMDTKLADQAIVTAEYAIDDERRIDIVIEMGSYFLPIDVGWTQTGKRQHIIRQSVSTGGGYCLSLIP